MEQRVGGIKKNEELLMEAEGETGGSQDSILDHHFHIIAEERVMLFL